MTPPTSLRKEAEWRGCEKKNGRANGWFKGIGWIIVTLHSHKQVTNESGTGLAELYVQRGPSRNANGFYHNDA